MNKPDDYSSGTRCQCWTLQQRRDSLVLAPGKGRCGCCRLRHNTTECSLTGEEGQPIKDILDKREEKKKKAWERSGKKQWQAVRDARKAAEKENKDLGIKFKNGKVKILQKSEQHAEKKDRKEKGPAEESKQDVEEPSNEQGSQSLSSDQISHLTSRY